MKTQTNLPDLFFTFNNCFQHMHEVIERREKAVKVKTTSYICYPGVNDAHGSKLGTAWLPISGLKQQNEDTFKLAGWVKPKYYRGE